MLEKDSKGEFMWEGCWAGNQSFIVLSPREPGATAPMAEEPFSTWQQSQNIVQYINKSNLKEHLWDIKTTPCIFKWCNKPLSAKAERCSFLHCVRSGAENLCGSWAVQPQSILSCCSQYRFYKKKRLTPFQTALFTAVGVARRVLDQAAGDKLRSTPLLSGGWPKRLMMTHNERTTSHIKASDHYTARMNESRWQTNTAVPFLLVLNFGEQFVCSKRDTAVDRLAVNPNKGLTDWSDLATWLECVSNPLVYLCVCVWRRVHRNYFYLLFFYGGREGQRGRFDQTLVLLDCFHIYQRK